MRRRFFRWGDIFKVLIIPVCVVLFLWLIFWHGCRSDEKVKEYFESQKMEVYDD